MSRFSEQTLRRYSRQILLREVGGRGQERLLTCRAEVVAQPGGGAIAAVAAQYLLRAGVAQVRWFAASEVDAGPLVQLQRCEEEPAAEESLGTLRSDESRLLEVAYSQRPDRLRAAPQGALCVAAWLPELGDGALYWATDTGCGLGEVGSLPAGPEPESPLGTQASPRGQDLDATALTLGAALSLAMVQGVLRIRPPAGRYFALG